MKVVRGLACERWNVVRYALCVILIRTLTRAYTYKYALAVPAVVECAEVPLYTVYCTLIPTLTLTLTLTLLLLILDAPAVVERREVPRARCGAAPLSAPVAAVAPGRHSSCRLDQKDGVVGELPFRLWSET